MPLLLLISMGITVALQSRHSAEILAGETLSTELGPRTILSEQLSFFPNLSSAGDYRVTFDANATTKLKSWLSWQVTLSDRYVTNPPLGLKKATICCFRPDCG